MSPLQRVWRITVTFMSIPIVLREYFSSDLGAEYGVSFFKKIWLMYRMAKNSRRIKTASHWLEHLIMATQILKVPRRVQGCVVECGSFKGGSAANLSLVCALCDRRLEIFDSFAGLPEPSSVDKSHLVVKDTEVHTYSKGAFCGTLDEVRKNIARFGEIRVCNFNVGFFEQSLPNFRQSCVFIFADVDLTESLQTCLRYLWPNLQQGCCLFTHEAPHVEIAALFFDNTWWQSNLRCKAPGLIGAGSGLGLLPSAGGFRSDLGYTVRSPLVAEFKISPQEA